MYFFCFVLFLLKLNWHQKMSICRIGKSIETGSRLMVVRGWREGEMVSDYKWVSDFFWG